MKTAGFGNRQPASMNKRAQHNETAIAAASYISLTESGESVKAGRGAAASGVEAVASSGWRTSARGISMQHRRK